MNISMPVYWEQGLFLHPQHFQLTQLYLHHLNDAARAFHGPFSWGVGKLDIDTEAVAARVFAINGGIFYFRDGTHITLPGNVQIEKRSFEGQWPQGRESMRVYLGIKRWDTAGGNVTEVENEIQPAKISTRFACIADEAEVPDLYGDGPSAPVKRLTLVARIFWEQEQDAAGDYELLPVAVINRQAESFGLSGNYIPPSCSHRAVGTLGVLLEEIISMIASRCRQLEELKRRPDFRGGKLGGEDLLEFNALNVLADLLPQLRYLYEAPSIHPWEFYGLLCQCAGRLSVFSPDMGADWQNSNGERQVPVYDHFNLSGCFLAIRGVLQRLLNQLSLGVENSVSLTLSAPGIYSGKLPDNLRDQRSQFFLVVRTREDQQRICNELLTIAKLSSGENIRAIASRFVGGVSLQHVYFPPSGVPNLSDALYFAVKVASPQWQDILYSGEVALYWEGAPADINIELVMQRNA